MDVVQGPGEELTAFDKARVHVREIVEAGLRVLNIVIVGSKAISGINN